MTMKRNWLLEAQVSGVVPQVLKGETVSMLGRWHGVCVAPDSELCRRPWSDFDSDPVSSPIKVIERRDLVTDLVLAMGARKVEHFVSIFDREMTVSTYKKTTVLLCDDKDETALSSLKAVRSQQNQLGTGQLPLLNEAGLVGLFFLGLTGSPEFLTVSTPPRPLWGAPEIAGWWQRRRDTAAAGIFS